jgi:hypothetical protein
MCGELSIPTISEFSDHFSFLYLFSGASNFDFNTNEYKIGSALVHGVLNSFVYMIGIYLVV